MPAPGGDLERYCENSPREVFAAFAGAARHMPPAGEDEALAVGYLFLLQMLLERLRHRADSGYADAATLIADFQTHVVAQVDCGDVDGRMLALVGGALHQSRIPASPELVAASARYGVDHADAAPYPPDADTAIGEVLKACGGDPYMAIGGLSESSHVLPPDARGLLGGDLARAGSPEARSIAVLLLLDPEPEVRRAVAAAIAGVAANLAPVDIRRLIAMRNWRPESERTHVDAVIRTARAAGIDCAHWEAGSADSVVATAIDGAAAQVFMLVSPAGRKKRLSSVLTRDGILDAGSGRPEAAGRMETTLAGMRKETPTLEVSRACLDRAVAHHLALTIEKGNVPPSGLLQVAETIGGADWQPARMAFKDALAGLLAEIPKRMREPEALVSMLGKSGELADLREIALSWYEDDPEVAQAVKGSHVRRGKLADYLLQSVIGRRRERWAEVVLRTALWLREGPAEAGLSWREAALIAKALADGRDMTEIGLMREMALHTVTVLRSEGRA